MGPLGWTFLAGALVGAAVVLYRRRLPQAAVTCAAIGLAVVPLVAIGQVTLPHTFSNGSVADANEVNENFAAIHDDNGRFHASVVGDPNPALREVAIPSSVTDGLCGDLDGCEVVVVFDQMTAGSLPSSAAARLQANAAFPERWRTDAGANGVDGDGARAPVVTTAAGCELSDGSTQVPHDPGLGSMVSIGSSVGTETCRLAIID